MTMLQFLSGEQAVGVGEARSSRSTFDFDPPGCAGVAVVCERFSLVNEVSARRVEMERLRMLLRRGEKLFFFHLRHHGSSSPRAIAKNERTCGQNGWLGSPPPQIKAPRPNLALMFRKLPEKKHNASKGGDFASINPSRGRGAPQTSMVRTMPYRIPTVRSSRCKVVSEVSRQKILCRMYPAGPATRQATSTRRK